MISLLLAEDERIERDALKALIQTKFSSRIDQIVAVSNGGQAMEACRMQRFDVIITDINMPVANGLEVLKYAKGLQPHAKTIILTGYDYFQYAQEAIRIGVDDFMLKPSSDQEICDCLERVLTRMNEDQLKQDHLHSRVQEIQMILQNDLIYTILYQESEQQIQKIFSVMGIDVQAACCFCIQRESLKISQLEECIEQLRQKYASCLYEPYFNHYVLFVFHDQMLTQEDIETMKTSIVSAVVDEKQISVSSIKTNYRDFYSAYVEAREQEVTISTETKECQDQHGVLDFLCEELKLAMEHGEQSHYDHVAMMFKKQCARLHKSKIQEQLRQFLPFIASSLQISSKYIEEQESLIEQVSNAEEGYQLLLRVLKECLQPIIKEKRTHMNKLIAASYEFIEQNYQKPIGLNDLASTLEVTPQYISSLLSQQSGSNFTTILAQYRISKAKTLLAQGMRIKEVAIVVGFQNQNYFAKTFKKITGYTPNEFKSMF